MAGVAISNTYGVAKDARAIALKIKDVNGKSNEE